MHDMKRATMMRYIFGPQERTQNNALREGWSNWKQGEFTRYRGPAYADPASSVSACCHDERRQRYAPALLFTDACAEAMAPRDRSLAYPSPWSGASHKSLILYL